MEAEKPIYKFRRSYKPIPEVNTRLKTTISESEGGLFELTYYGHGRGFISGEIKVFYKIREDRNSLCDSRAEMFCLFRVGLTENIKNLL